MIIETGSYRGKAMNTQQYDLPLTGTPGELYQRTFEPYWGQGEYELYANDCPVAVVGVRLESMMSCN